MVRKMLGVCGAPAENSDSDRWVAVRQEYQGIRVAMDGTGVHLTREAAKEFANQILALCYEDDGK